MQIGAWHFPPVVLPILLGISFVSWLLSRWLTPRTAILGAAGFAGLIGITLAVGASRPPAYAAAYGFGGAWLFFAAFLVAGVPMLPFRVLRLGGVIAVAAGISVLVAFYIAVGVSRLMGFTS